MNSRSTVPKHLNRWSAYLIALLLAMTAGAHALAQGHAGTGGAPSPDTGTINPATGTNWTVGDTYHLAFVTSSTTNMSARENIHFWNDYVNGVAAGSALPGIPNLSWKVIGSDVNTHARDNALVTAPVYLVDATTKIADGFAWMWNGSIDANLDLDESGNPGSGDFHVWSGSNNNGTTVGNRSFNGIDDFVRRGQRNIRDGRWLSWDDKTRSENKHLYALSQPIQIVDAGAGADTTPPLPSTMTWAELPNGHSPTSIRMRGTLAHDLQSPPIEYFFTNTVTGSTRTWDTSRSWTETVAPYSQHTFMVKARDAAGNETGWSVPHTAVPLNLGPGGVAAPNGIHPVTGLPWQPGDIYQLAFVSSSLHTMTNRYNVHVWNDVVDDIADGSTLTGVPALTWKVIGSDRQVHARDNALVTSPVYRMDATSKIADGFDDLWDNFIDVRLDRDESGNAGTGTSSTWTGSNNNGTSAGLRSFDHPLDNFVRRGERTQLNNLWVSRDDRNRTEANHVYGLSQPIRIADGSPDNEPPVPAIMTWAQAPNGETPTTILMRATLAHDLDNPPVQYFFTNTVTQETRDWSESRTWTNNVTANSLHTYLVKARDALGNETAFSAPYEATPLLQGPGGVAAPTGIHPLTGLPWQPGDEYQLTFLTSTMTNMLSREDINFWNDYIQTVAEGSSLTGIPELGWKVIGSDLQTHARDNAPVTAPVYLVDATTKIADGFDDMWDNSIDARLDLDEHGNIGAGESRGWTGSNANGTSAGLRSFNHPHDNNVRTGERSQVNQNWISRDDRSRSDDRRMYALSQPIRIAGGPTDTTPPSPDPMSFAVLPAGDTPTSIHMRATLAHDLDSPPVEYLFTNSVNGEISGWQSEPDWIDSVPPGMVNTYRVKARDGVGNETAWSDPVTAKPLLLGPNGVLAPEGINPLTGELWTDGDSYHLAFVSSTVDDLNTVRDIDGWNAYVDAIADGSTLAGVPATDWKIIGSTTNVHARDNALVNAPVYLLDGTTKIADGFTDLWDNRIDAPLNLDENAVPGTGTADIWSGSTANGLSGGTLALNGTNGNAWRGHRTVAVNNQWLGRDAQNRNGQRHFYALSEALTIGFTAVNVVNGAAGNFGAGTADLGGTVYAPNGQTVDVTVYWSTTDNADGAAWLTDGSASSQVLGTFNNVSGQAISASVSGLSPNTVYYYTFRGVNAEQEVWATPNASFAVDTQPPNPDPMAFAVLPTSNGPDEIRMTAATATDALSPPVEYYFENLTAPANSGWIPDATYAFTGLASDTSYDFRVRARDAAGNETAFSPTASGSTGIPWDGLVAYWSFDDADVSGTTLLDLADDAGAGKGDHDATLIAGVRPASDLPGDPDGGLTGNYYDANGNGYALVDTFANGAVDGDLEAGEQITIAGWFRERPDGNDEPWIAKRGEENMGWQLRRTGGGNQARFTLRDTSGPDDTPSLNITSDINGGPWYFMAATYTKDNATESTLNFYGADSGATNKTLNLVSSQLHTPDIEAGAATNDFVALGAMSRGTIQRHSSTKMDEVAIWNRGLSQEEVTAWYGLSYFSGLKANDPAIQTLLTGGVGTAVTGVGPHGHDWSRISFSGDAGSITGSVAMADAIIQITPSEALQLTASGVNDDLAATDDKTPISMGVLNNDVLDGGSGAAGDLEVSAITQPAEGLVSIDGGSQSLTFDPSGSALLRNLKPGESSVQTFTYTARNTTTAATDSGTVTVTVSGLASLTDGLVAHWTFDDADVSGQTALDLADDAGDGKGDHDATLFGGLRPSSDLPGDPNGGLAGNYFDANGNDYGIVDTFANGAHHSDLDAGEQFTVAGWFRERPDGNEDALISKYGESQNGWDIRRNGGGNSVRTDLRGTSGADNPAAYNITADNDGGPWYFFATTYTKESDTFSSHRFYAADSEGASKGLAQVGSAVAHSTDNDATPSGSMVVFGARDNTNAETTPPAIDRHSNTRMDDIGFWKRGLSHEELTALYGLSYFSGLKANDPAITTLLDGAVGTTVNAVGPHGHNWTRISNAGTAGDLSGSVASADARVQITPDEALQFSLSDAVADDAASTDEQSAIVLAVLLNDQINGAPGNSGDLEITAITQPAEGAVSIDGGSQTLTFDPTGSAVLNNLLVGQTSVQTFGYTARNVNTLTTGNGTVTVTVTGLASFGDGLVAHWTFDDADVNGQTAFDLADDAGFGKGDHDATLFGGTRPSSDLPGDPDGGSVGNYFNANGNDYGVVDSFGGAATHGDLDAGEQFTVAGWFRERPSGNQARYISKNGEGTSGWDLRRNGTADRALNWLRGTSGTQNSPEFNIAPEDNGGPWYFMAITYTKGSDFYSTRQFYTADSGAVDKGLNRIGNPDAHSPDNDAGSTGSMLVFAGRDSSDNASNPPAIGNHGNVKLDDLAFWNRGLSQEEVSAWYGLSYFSGLKATDPAITALLDGAVGASVVSVGPHGHNWTKIASVGTAGDLSGSVAGEDALVQITDTEALQLSLPDVVADDAAMTDEETAISISVLNNDKIDGAAGGSGDLEITAVTQPAEGAVSIDGGSQTLTFDPTGSTVLKNLLAGQTSVQTFGYTARNVNTLTTDNGTVTVTVTGLASFGDGLVAHWTFDDADVSGQTAFDLADDAGFGKGDHDATLFGGTRPSSDLPGDPDGGPVGNYFNANGNDYGVVDTFGGAADHSDLDAGEQFTVAGWFRERPSGNQARYISKNGEGTTGWDLRRNGNSDRALNWLRGTSGTQNSPEFNIAPEDNGGPWYFMAITYTRGSDFYSTRQFYAADSGAVDKGLNRVGNPDAHSPDNDVGSTGSMLVFAGRDFSDNASNPPVIGNHGSVKLDDLAFWNRGLSQEEVTAWYGLSYFSGLKATNAAIQVLLDGAVGSSVVSVGPHGHNWTKIASVGTAGDLSGSVAGVDALVQITDTEALQLSLPDGVADDDAVTDEATAISIAVLVNDLIDGANAASGDLEITAVTQPAEGAVTIDGGSQSLSFDPSGSAVLKALLAGQTSVQTFGYTARNTTTSTTDNGTVTVTVTGLPSFGEGLVAHWTFDDADVAGQTIFDTADDAGFGKGDHDATIMGAGITRPATGLPGDPGGGPTGNFLNIESNAYAIVDLFGGAAQNNDLDAGEQFTVAGWFREIPDGNEELHISKYGDGNVGWDLRRQGNSARLRAHVRGSDGPDNTPDFNIVNDTDGGPWYFLALSYTRESEFYSTFRFFTADSEAVDKSLSQFGSTGIHSPDNDVADTGSLMVFGARDVSNNATTAPSIQRHGNTEMDDIAFWNRGLSQTELVAWYGLSYFSGAKATDTAIALLLEGPVGTLASIGPHNHGWTKIANSGSPGALSGTVGGSDAMIQLTATEALLLTGTSPDNDMDGIPDSIDPDDDNDGMSDVDEAVAGTDDKDENSFLYLLIERTGTTNTYLFNFPSVLGRTYHIEGRESLDSGNWSIILPNIPGAGGMQAEQATDPVQREYYRIGVTNP